MATFARAIVQGCHIAVAQQREFSFRCTYQGRPSQLLINLDRGFSLIDTIMQKQIFSHTFDKLKGSTDDGQRVLFFDFGGEEYEIELECSPKIVVFILHNCLSAKVHSLA